MNILGTIRIVGGRGPFTAQLVDSDVPSGRSLVVGGDGRDVTMSGADVPHATYTFTVEITDTATSRTATRDQVVTVA